MAKEEEIIQRGNLFLNDGMNMTESLPKLYNDFFNDISKLDKKNIYEITDKYADILNTLRFTYQQYNTNVKDFERHVLRLNSVISSTLTIECRIKDILSNKLIYKSAEKTQQELLKNQNVVLNGLIEEYKEDAQLRKKLRTLQLENKVLIERTEEKIDDDQKAINEYKEDYYYIGNISKEKELKELLSSICRLYIKNELIESIRNEFFIRYNIIIQDENKRKDRIKCIMLGAYMITVNKVKEVKVIYAKL